MALLSLYVVLAVGVSFLCSIMEAVLLSVTPAYIGALEKDAPSSARQLRALKDDIERPLAAILSLNTVAHTVGAAGAGAQAAVVFGSAAVGVFSAVLTLAILVLSEVIPKTFGAVYWRALAPVVAQTLGPMIWVLGPLVWLCQLITGLVSRGKEDEPAVSREELIAMADIGELQGVIEADETRIVKNLMRFRGLTAKDVMTPRTVLVAFPESATAAQVTKRDIPFSRIPVYDENPDQVTGYRQASPGRLRKGARPPCMLPANPRGSPAGREASRHDRHRNCGGSCAASRRSGSVDCVRPRHR